MTITAEPWNSSSLHASGRLLFQLPLPVLHAFANNDLETANTLLPHLLPPYVVSSECLGVWRMRRDQIAVDPADAIWVTRLVVDATTCAVVGRAGFHGQPDKAGMVEVGYAIDPLHRRRGHASAALAILLEMTKGDERMRVVRASVRPDNVASRALVEQFGFCVVGDQWDEEDGLEIVLEVLVR